MGLLVRGQIVNVVFIYILNNKVEIISRLRIKRERIIIQNSSCSLAYDHKAMCISKNKDAMVSDIFSIIAIPVDVQVLEEIIQGNIKCKPEMVIAYQE